MMVNLILQVINLMKINVYQTHYIKQIHLIQIIKVNSLHKQIGPKYINLLMNQIKQKKKIYIKHLTSQLYFMKLIYLIQIILNTKI